MSSLRVPSGKGAALHEAIARQEIAGSHGLGIWAAPFGVDVEKVL